MAMKVIDFDSVPLMLQPVISENIVCYATSYSQRLTALEKLCDCQKNET